MSVLERRTYLPAAERRAQILDVARAVFAARGYHEASIADICEAARIGRGTLYQYFDNKRAVMLGVMEDLLARIDRVLSSRPPLGDLPGLEQARRPAIIAFTRRGLREILDTVFVDEASLRLILRDARGVDRAVDDVIARIDARILLAMESDLRAGQRAGVIRAGDARLLSLYLLGGVEKLVLAALAAAPPVDVSAIVDTVVEIELFGILSEEART